jgi:hypothetical protein
MGGGVKGGKAPSKPACCGCCGRSQFIFNHSAHLSLVLVLVLLLLLWCSRLEVTR